MNRFAMMSIGLVGCAPPQGSFESHAFDAVAVEQTYTLEVFVPDSAGPHDVVVVFDGDDWTRKTARIVSRLAAEGRITAPMVVGVGYGDTPNRRGRDYTPEGPDIPEGHGEIEPFFRFVVDELVPWVDDRYDTTATRNGRVLLGHSFGGLAAAWGALQATDTFGASVALSPSFTFADGAVFALEQEYAATHDDLAARIHLGAGSLEAFGLAGLTQAFHDELVARAYPNLDVQLGLEPNRVHADLFPVGAEHGLAFVLEDR